LSGILQENHKIINYKDYLFNAKGEIFYPLKKILAKENQKSFEEKVLGIHQAYVN